LMLVNSKTVFDGVEFWTVWRQKFNVLITYFRLII
jgi:hypothetical protein